MKGPLDSLIESEVLAAGGLDDPMGGPELNPPVSKKFKLRRFLRNLFRRKKSNTVRVKAADPKQVKIILISWGVAVFILLGLLTAFWFFGTSSEYLQKAEKAVAAKDYERAIEAFDNFLSRYPNDSNANEVRVRRCLAELRLAEKQATASGDWTPAFEVAKQAVSALPKDRSNADLMEEVGIALAKIGEGLAHEMQAHPDTESVNRVQSVVNMLGSSIPEDKRPDKLIEEIMEVLTRARQEVESGRDLDQTVAAIAAAAGDSDVNAAYTAYRDLIKSYPELGDNVRLADAIKPVSAIQQKLVKLAHESLAAVHDERPSSLVAAMPLAVQPMKGRLPEGRGKLVFAVEQGTAYGLDAATGNVLWRRIRGPRSRFARCCRGAAGPWCGCGPGRQRRRALRSGTPGTAPRARRDGRTRLAIGCQAADRCRAGWRGQMAVMLTKDQRLTLIDLATGDSSQCFRFAAGRQPAAGRGRRPRPGLPCGRRVEHDCSERGVGGGQYRPGLARGARGRIRSPPRRRLWATFSSCPSTIRPARPRSTSSRFPRTMKANR